ncbi:uncharacterized protein JCM6883_005256 [Sporobolomyces salmoneus]|uniref:uncharacterized protein n=1 Tax=Sporobolomyces salmoneus TaxID=183962 RepID=UPI00318206B3
MAFPGLAQKIKQQYNQAIKNGTVLFTESEVIELEDERTQIPFEVRFAPALAKKPTKSDGEKAQEKPKDPFAPPYQPDLFVAEDTVKEDEDDRGEEFAVLLNKFCVTPRHFLLVTKDFVKQTTPLSPVEVFAAFSILKQLGTREKHLAFFNCGPESGASQPHKHLQFIPLSNGVAPFDAFIDSNRPQDTRACFQLPLPYANFTALLDLPTSPQDIPGYLGDRFLLLLDLMIDHLRRLAEASPSLFSSSDPIRLSNLSYNVIITTQYIHLVPRSAELFKTEEGREISINSLGFAGMVLVKEQEALKEIRKVGVVEVLKGVGYRPVVEGDTNEVEKIQAQQNDDAI